MTATQQEISETIEYIVRNDPETYKRWIVSADIQLNLKIGSQREAVVGPEDVINTLVEKLICGKRRWDREKYPDFTIYFSMLIESHVSNLAKHERKNVSLITETAQDDEEGMSSTKLAIYSPPNNEESIEEQDRELFKETCLNALECDEEKIIFLEICEEKTNTEIAEYLGVNVSHVENAKKRIKRKLLPLVGGFFGRKSDSSLLQQQKSRNCRSSSSG